MSIIELEIFQQVDCQRLPTWWFIPRIVSGLVHPSYKWKNSTYPIYNWGYNPLTIRGMSHQAEISLYISSSVDKSLAIFSGDSSPTADPSQLVVMVTGCMDSLATNGNCDGFRIWIQSTRHPCGVSIFFWVTKHGDFKIVQAGPHAYSKRVRSQNMGESQQEKFLEGPPLGLPYWWQTLLCIWKLPRLIWQAHFPVPNSTMWDYSNV